MWRRDDNSTSHLPGFRNCGMIWPFQHRRQPSSLTREDVDQSHLFEAVVSRRGLRGDKRLCLTPDGYLSIDTNAAMMSDQVYNSLGRDISRILRPDEGRTTHRLVGETYVHDFITARLLSSASKPGTRLSTDSSW
jgi:hypothetical protein